MESEPIVIFGVLSTRINIALLVVSGVYVYIVSAGLQLYNKELNLQLACLIISYIKDVLFWYSLVFIVVTTIPYTILSRTRIPSDAYPVQKNSPTLNTMYYVLSLHFGNLFNMGTSLTTVIGPAFYLYNCVNLGFMTIIEIAIAITYYLALYQSFGAWFHFITYSYYAIFDTIAIWKFMLLQSRQSRSANFE